MNRPSRTVRCEDAIAWLRGQGPLAGVSFITSLPDVSELDGFSVEKWSHWFVDAAELVLTRTPPEGVAIFFQTDVKKDGAWVDKGYLVSKAAERVGARTLWHKVVC
ncbi:MAG: SAM-dependent methyltransferase, partial [Myxococcaceae bacterium]